MDSRCAPRYDETAAAHVLGVPRTTVRRWRRQVLVPRADELWSFLDLAEGYVLASFRHATGRLPRLDAIHRLAVPHPLACREGVDPGWPAAVRKRLKPVQWAADGYIIRFPVAHTDDRVVVDARLCAGHPVCARTGAPVAAVLPLLQAGLPVDRVVAESGWTRDDVEAATLYKEAIS